MDGRRQSTWQGTGRCESRRLNISVVARRIHRGLALTVFAHELVQLDIVWVVPPVPPLVGIRRCDTGISDWRVEPDINDFSVHRLVLLLIADSGYLDTPLQVPRDGARPQTIAQHSRLDNFAPVRDDRVAIPVAFFAGSAHPFDQFGLDQVEAEASVCRRADRDGVVLVTLTTGVEELGRGGVGERALVALISSGVLLCQLRPQGSHRRSELTS